MKREELLQKVIEENGGIARTSDFEAVGLNKFVVANYCKKGAVERVRWGFYKIPGSDGPTEEKLVHEIIPQGIVCVESALYHYGYCDLPPAKWSIAVPRSASRVVKNIKEFPVKAYYIQKEFFNMGKITDDFDGITLSVYDRERAICDAFKYRTRIDGVNIDKAVEAYINDDRKNLSNLVIYAKKLHVYNKMSEVMGSNMPKDEH